ncbi:hypothetical protein [Bartonella sp. B17]
MNMRCFLIIFTIIFGFSSIVKASECTDIKGSASIIIDSTGFSEVLFFNDHDESLLNKVVSSSYTIKHSASWKDVKLVFDKIKKVYYDLGIYFYNFFLSMFKW